MIQVLKNKLKTIPFIKGIIIGRDYKVDDRTRDIVNAMNMPNGVLVVNHYGDLNKGKLILNIKTVDPAKGFFAAWKDIILGLSVANEFGMVPVASWTEAGPYYDPQNKGNINPFEYFYYPTSSITIDELNHSNGVVTYYPGIGSSEFNSFQSYEAHYDQIDLYAKYNQKLIIRSEIQKQLDSDVDNLLKHEEVIGVHIRGIDWGSIKDHPVPISLSTYKKILDSAMSKYKFSKVFIASDSEETVQYFKKCYGNKVLTYDDVSLAKSGSHTLAIFDSQVDKGGFRLGYEVLRDMYTLSKCKGLIAGYSNISLAAMVYKRSRDEKYLFQKLLKNKIQKGGITAGKAVKMEKKGIF